MEGKYLKNYRVEYEGNVWYIDAKIWPLRGNRSGKLKVYRIDGDINKVGLLKEALYNEFIYAMA
jgi:hypothetical protein